MKYPVYYNRSNDTYFMVTDDDDKAILLENAEKTILDEVLCNGYNCKQCKVDEYITSYCTDVDDTYCEDVIIENPEILEEAFPNIMYRGSFQIKDFNNFIMRARETDLESTTDNKVKEDNCRQSYNAVITETSLREDHGCLTLDLWLEGDGFQILYGGYCLGHYGNFYTKTSGMHAISSLMYTLGVDKYESLKGTHVRVEFDNGKKMGSKISRIGHLLKDNWFSFADYFTKCKNMESEE